MSEKYKLMGILILIMISFSSVHFYGKSETLADTTPPVTTIEFAGPLYIKNGEKWIGQQTFIWLNATDDLSGVRYTYYEIWKDTNDDGVIDTKVESKKVDDNSPADKNPFLYKIAIKFNISEECFHAILYYSEDRKGNIENHSIGLIEEWHYPFQPVIIHEADNVIFGSSPAIGNITGNEKLEIFTGSDEMNNTYPELNGSWARGIWRCFDAYGNIVYALDTQTDEARSSPAIADIDNDGIKEIVGGTTSGWFVETIEDEGFEWTFPSFGDGPVYQGPYVWHSSPAIVDAIPEVGGIEVIIGNNPYKSIWCFDGDNSDGIDEGININPSYFPGYLLHRPSLGNEGVDWDVLWVFNTSGNVIATPAIGDVDKDGLLEVTIGDLSGEFYILNATNGVKEWNFTTGGAIYSSASFADIDNDDLLEILFGSNDGKLYCLQWDGSNGNKEWNFTTGGAIYSSPAIADVNGDNEYEIIFGSNDGNVYCLNKDGNLLWNFTTGGAIYSSPAIADVNYFSPAVEGDKKYAEEWPLFRGNLLRNGTYLEKGKKLDIFICSEDHYIYELDGDGSLIDKFLTNGKVHTSPAVADVDGDGYINIVFYDWGREEGSLDTFWCLERRNKSMELLHVDALSPKTVKKVMSEDEYNVPLFTQVWLNATDIGKCVTGINYLHYEIWWDSNGDNTIDTQIVNETVEDNGTGDENPAKGIISVLITLDHEGKNEIRWYSVDRVGNFEVIHYQEHIVIPPISNMSVTKEVNRSKIHEGNSVKYWLNITNTGDINLTNIVITDNQSLSFSYSSGDDGDGILEPGETWVYTCITNIYEDTWNKVNVSAEDELGKHVYDEDVAYVNVIAPNISIEKKVSTDNATWLDYVEVHRGNIVYWNITITNNGDNNLSNVYVNDTNGNSFGPFDLAIGESKAFYYTTVAEDVNNTAIAEGKDEIGIRVSDEDWAIVNAISPELDIEKIDDPHQVEANTTLIYTLNITNNGEENATNVIVTEKYDINVTFISAVPNPTMGNNVWIFPRLNISETRTIIITVEVSSTVLEGTRLKNYANVTCNEGSYDEVWIETPVVSYPPETYKKFNGKVINVTVLENGEGYTIHYILRDTTIDLVAVDNASGVDRTYYRIFKWEDGWKLLFDWHIYGVWNPMPPYYPINLADLGVIYNSSPCGKYEIEFYSIDNAGNVEEVKWNDVFVDCFAPTSSINLVVNNRSVDVFSSAQDVGVGIERIELYYRYSQDNVTWSDWIYCGTNYSWHFDLLPDGYYEFYSVAYDKLGNHEAIPNASSIAKARCKISYPWDINVDGRVNVNDVYLVILHWMETPSSLNWDEKVDVNKDEIIDASDILAIVAHWTG